MDETIYWIELLSDARIVPTEKLALLQSEANELMAILIASVKTAKRRRS